MIEENLDISARKVLYLYYLLDESINTGYITGDSGLTEKGREEILANMDECYSYSDEELSAYSMALFENMDITNILLSFHRKKHLN